MTKESDNFVSAAVYQWQFDVAMPELEGNTMARPNRAVDMGYENLFVHDHDMAMMGKH